MIADWQTLISWQNSDLIECMLFGHTPALHIQLEVIQYSDLVRSLASSGSSRDEVISWNVFDFLAGVSSPPLPCVSKRHCQAFC